MTDQQLNREINKMTKTQLKAYAKIGYLYTYKILSKLIKGLTMEEIGN